MRPPKTAKAKRAKGGGQQTRLPRTAQATAGYIAAAREAFRFEQARGTLCRESLGKLPNGAGRRRRLGADLKKDHQPLFWKAMLTCGSIK